MEKEAAAAAVRKKSTKHPVADNDTDYSNWKDLEEKEIRFRSGSGYRGRPPAVSDLQPPPPPTATRKRQMKAASLLDENVEEFYAILRRVRGVAKCLRKSGESGDLNWLTVTAALETGLDGGGARGKYEVRDEVVAPDVVKINAVCFDLNADPQSDEESASD